jgi:hypothetical protein
VQAPLKYAFWSLSFFKSLNVHFLIPTKCALLIFKARFDINGLSFFVVGRVSALLLLSTDGCGRFQAYEDPLNEVKALAILKVHLI